MTTQSTFPMNDLVLRLSGGQRDGELIPVSTPKCYLGMDDSEEGGEQPQCAIFRGPKGAAVKSYASEVLVNGVASSVHWLKEGDRIEFPNSVSIEVTQLGWVEQACEEHAASEFETENESNTCETMGESSAIGSDPEPGYEGCDDPYYQPAADQLCEEESVGKASNELVNEETVNEEFAATDPSTESTEIENVDSNQDLQLDSIESQINEIKEDKKQAEERLCKLDEKLLCLTEQMSQLVSIAGGEPSVEGEATESELETNPVELKEEEPQAKEEVVAQGDQPSVNSLNEDSTETNQYGSLGEYYSHTDEDDEKIMTFDASEPSEELPMAANVEVEDAPAELSGVTREEIESRQSELEKVFGGALGEDSDSDDSNDNAEVILSPSAPESIEQTADEQPTESFETPTHGLNDDAASFADPTNESDSSQVSELEPGSLASQLLSAVQADEVNAEEVTVTEEAFNEEAFNEKTLNEESVTEEPVTEEPVNEETANEEASDDTDSSDTNETGGVADLLARMKAEGKWDGVPEGDEEPQAIEPVSQPEPIIETPVSSGAEETDDVQDYMSQLLNRMRGDSPEKPAAPVASPSSKSEPAPESDEDDEEATFVPPANPLKAEEFKPMRKAQKIASLGAMRELANSTARNNVKKSEDKNRKELGYLQLGIAVCSFFMAVFYFLVQSEAIMDTGFIVGLVCVVISGFLGYRYYSAMRHNELIEAMPASNEPATEEEATAEVAEAEVASPEAS